MKNLNRIFMLVLVALVITPFTGSVVLGLGIVSGLAMLLPSASGVLNSTIPVQDAQGLFTKKMIAVYREKISPMSFLRSFFSPIETMTKEVSIAVRRGTEKVAVDVSRFSEGNRNEWSKSTEKMIIPPMYDEYLTANEHMLYDRVITSLSENQTTFFNELTAEIAEETMMLQEKIERAIELQCSQVLETGIVQLNANTNIDFKRKAASLVAHSAATNWATGTVNPYKTLEDGCKFLRNVGKVQGGTFNAILGSQAISDLYNNTIFKERNDLSNISLDTIAEPQRNSVGGTLHGILTVGSYRVRLWTYPEVYDNASSTSIPYVNEKKVILLPEMPKFKLAYAAVPQLISDGKVEQKGAYLIQEFIDHKRTAHEIHVKSAPIAIPVAVDQIYTVQVVA